MSAKFEEVKIATKISNLDCKPEMEREGEPGRAVDGEVYGGFCPVHYGQKIVSLIVRINMISVALLPLPPVTSTNLTNWQNSQLFIFHLGLPPCDLSKVKKDEIPI